MLGPGRHLLFDLGAAKPYVYVVSVATDASSVSVVEKVEATATEQDRFDLSRRLLAGTGPLQFTVAELHNWLRPRNVARTTATVLAAGALRHDLIDALDALLPASLPTAPLPPCAAPGCVTDIVFKVDPGPREISLVLDDRGVVLLDWSKNGLVVRTIRDAHGSSLPLDADDDFTHGKVYIFGDRPSMVRFRQHLQTIGFNVDIPDTANAIRCIQTDGGIDCTDAGDWANVKSSRP